MHVDPFNVQQLRYKEQRDRGVLINKTAKEATWHVQFVSHRSDSAHFGRHRRENICSTRGCSGIPEKRIDAIHEVAGLRYQLTQGFDSSMHM